KTIFDFSTNKAVGLAIHGLRTKSGGNKVNVLSSKLRNVTERLLSRLGPFSYLELNGSVFLRTKSLTRCTIVIHAWLLIKRRVNGITFAEANLVQMLQNVHLPSDKGVVVGVGVGG